MKDPRSMKEPEEVAAMLRLWAVGWGLKRIGREFGCSHHTVKRYVDTGGFVAYNPPFHFAIVASNGSAAGGTYVAGEDCLDVENWHGNVYEFALPIN
jgi:hypothetical protein